MAAYGRGRGSRRGGSLSAIREILQFRGVGVLLLAIILRVASGPTGDLSFIVLGIFALFGKRQAIIALLFSWLFLMLNPALFPGASFGAIGRYFVLLAALKPALTKTESNAGGVRSHASHPLTVILTIFIFYHSLIYSQMPDVSLLKLASWALTFFILLKCWGALPPQARSETQQFIYVFLVAIAMISVPLLAIGAGREVNGRGFQGVLGHPQAFGVVIGLLGAWTALLVLSRKDPPVAMYLLVPVCCALIILSQARTGLLAMLIGIVVAVMSSPALSGRKLSEIMPGLTRPPVVFGMLGSLVLLPLTSVFLGGAISQFIQKQGGAETVADAYMASRGGLIEEMLQNIERNFYSGIGFGIGSNPHEMEILRDPILGLPVSALVEKGALPFAVFEELGVFGFAIFVAWLASIVFRSARSGIVPLGLTTVFVALNMGEATLFSAGGVGMLGLIFLAWAVTGNQLDQARAGPYAKNRARVAVRTS